jgi:hypothetical protein
LHYVSTKNQIRSPLLTKECLCKHRRASATNRWTWRARIGPGRSIQVRVLKQEKQLKTLPGRTLDWHPNTLPTPTNLTHAWVHVVSCPRALFELQGDLWTRSGGPYRRRARIRPGGRNTHQNMHRTPQNTQRVLGARIYDQYGCTCHMSGTRRPERGRLSHQKCVCECVRTTLKTPPRQTHSRSKPPQMPQRLDVKCHLESPGAVCWAQFARWANREVT